MKLLLKTDLIEHVAKEARLTRKAAKEAIESLVAGVEKSLGKGEKVVVSGFGTFLVRGRRARAGRNPKTGEVLQLPSMKTIGFIPSKSLKKVVK